MGCSFWAPGPVWGPVLLFSSWTSVEVLVGQEQAWAAAVVLYFSPRPPSSAPPLPVPCSVEAAADPAGLQAAPSGSSALKPPALQCPREMEFGALSRALGP